MFVFEARGLTKEFHGFKAVSNVDFGLEEGSVHAVIGPNGAGKSTLFNLLTKFLEPTAGGIFLRGRDVTRLSPPAMALQGVVRSFQISAVFAALTVRENIELSLLRRHGLAWSFFGSAARLPDIRRRVDDVIETFGLSDHRETRAANLSYGRKRVLELATTLALEPTVLLLDEPMAGLGHEDIERVARLVKQAGEGRSILLVEHNMSVVADLADMITVMVRGEILAQGRYEEVSARPDVIAAYTGGLA